MHLCRKLVWVGLIAAFVNLGVLTVRADYVYMTDGTVKEGTIIEETDEKVVLEMTIRGIKASLHIPKAEIERVERATSIRETLAAQEQSLEPEDAEGWYKLGLKYKTHNLPEEAKRCFEKALRAKPDHEGASKELAAISVVVGATSPEVEEAIKKGSELVDAKEYDKAIEKLEPLLGLSQVALNSLQRRDVLNLLIQCYECKGNWAKAQETYELLLKCPTVSKSDVARIRVKQQILKNYPDGMIDLGAYEAKRKAQGTLKLEDIPLEIGKGAVGIATLPIKAGEELVKGVAKAGGKQPSKEAKTKKKDEPQYEPGRKLSLSDPKVMEAVIRGEAETILLEAQKKMERADAQAQTDKIWEFTLFPTLANLATGNRPKQITVRSSPADKLYEEAANDAEDADLLVPGISAPLRLKIAQKRAALLDDHIEKTRKEMESHPYYMPPPTPNTPPAQAQSILQQQNQKLYSMNVTQESAAKYLDILLRLDALYARKIELLEPFSDQILQQVEKVQKDREQILDVRKRAEKIQELAEAIKENEKLEALFAEYWVKARANDPRNFEDQMGYEKFIDASGVYRFKDGGRRWRAQVDLCVSYCEKALEVGRKRIALLKKFPERPQFVSEINTIKNTMVTIYQLEQAALMSRDRKGRAARYY